MNVHCANMYNSSNKAKLDISRNIRLLYYDFMMLYFKVKSCS